MFSEIAIWFEDLEPNLRGHQVAEFTEVTKSTHLRNVRIYDMCTTLKIQSMCTLRECAKYLESPESTDSTESENLRN